MHWQWPSVPRGARVPWRHSAWTHWRDGIHHGSRGVLVSSCQRIWADRRPASDSQKGTDPSLALEIIITTAAISLQVIEHGKIIKHRKVEVYFMNLLLADNSRPEATVKKKFSKCDSLTTIEKSMRELFNIPDNVSTRLWTKYSEKVFELLPNLDTTIQDSSMFHDQIILIEKQNPDGSWERDAGQNAIVASDNFSSAKKSATNSAYANNGVASTSTANNSKISTTGTIEKRETTPGPSTAPISTR